MQYLICSTALLVQPRLHVLGAKSECRSPISTSTSSVNVEGIGNVASVTVGDGTSMDVDMGLRPSATATGQNGSANGSANLTLNTASTAAVSNSQFASGFIQAFEAN